jgi:hypothetical protein
VIESINQEKVMFTFARLDRLPPYVFATVNEIKMEARSEKPVTRRPETKIIRTVKC